MNRITLKTVYREYDSPGELSSRQQVLIMKAIEAAGRAYAPYSGFRVGAAVQLANGEIITGNNQENAAYPSGLCAERVALFYAGANYPGEKIIAIAITATEHGKPLEMPVSPCGGCRQVMLETELRHNHPVEVILHGAKKTRVLKSAADLLPLPFTLSPDSKGP
ncbi:MAG: cytidine deaminase [Bacteroidales bacterium]|nr:cytidine deaminase [Bacteroidales bacterium]